MKQRLIFGVIVLIIGTYIIAQAVRFFTDGYYTEAPYIFTITNTYATEGIIIRDELAISQAVGENIVYTVDEGEKVLPHTKVASEYSTAEDKERMLEIIRDKGRAEKLKNVSEYSTAEDKERMLEIIRDKGRAEKLKNVSKPTGTVDVSRLTYDIVSNLSELAEAKAEGYVNKTSDASVDLLVSLARSELAEAKAEGYVNKTSDASVDLLVSLARANMAVGKKVELKPIEIGAEPSARSYTTGQRGIFSSYTDGYEKELKPELLSQMNFDMLDQLLKKDYVKSSGLGKVLKSINWYYVCEVDYYNGKIFQGAGPLLMTFPGSDGVGLYGDIKHVIEDKAGDRTLLVISSRDIAPEMLGSRTRQINFAFPNYKGIRFSKDALRVVDGKQGVYTMGTSAISFKTVDIIYTGPDFYLSRPNYSINTDQLSVFDEVIVRGKNLYDGKPLE